MMCACGLAKMEQGESDSAVIYENGQFLAANPNPFGSFDDEFGSPPALPVRRHGSVSSTTTDKSHNSWDETRERAASRASKVSSYDEMGINHGRPYVIQKVPDETDAAPTGIETRGGEEESDSLTSVAFESPLKELQSRSPPPRIRPIPAPRLSKLTKPNYENHDIPTTILQSLNNSLPQKIEDPKQKIVIEPEEYSDPIDADDNENFYSEIDSNFNVPDSEIGEEVIPSILDEDIAETERIYMDIDEIRAQQNPESWSRLNTIAIRDNFNKLWEEAAKELDREEKFVQEIEKMQIKDTQSEAKGAVQISRSSSGNQHSYDSVALPGAKFRIQNGVQVPVANFTLLKNQPPPNNPYENVWVPSSRKRSYLVHSESSDEKYPDSITSSSTSLSYKSGGEPDPQTCVYAQPIKNKHVMAVKGMEDDSQSMGKGTPHGGSVQSLRDVGRSSSTSNLSFLTKKFSFSKMTRKLSEQVMKPNLSGSKENNAVGASQQSSPKESKAMIRVDALSKGSRSRRGSALSDSSWSGTTCHSGPLYVYSKSKKTQAHEKWCVLGNAALSYFHHQDSLAEPKEAIHLQQILSLNKRTVKDENGILFCFDVAFTHHWEKFQKHGSKLIVRTFGSTTTAIRDTWVDKIAQSLSVKLETFSMHDCSKLGWVFLKVMFAGEWHPSWISLRGPFFYYGLKDEDTMERIDLKKTKNVTLVKETKNLNAPEFGAPVIVVDFVDRSLYLQARHEKEIHHWKFALESLAFNNGQHLSEQQVTKDEIPVIVDQCVNFVFRHGLLTEGIYRHSGVKTKIDRLLDQFQKNAWAVGLSREEFSEHDVANALKRFMRTLDEPLLTEALRPMWMEASMIEQGSEKLERYEELLLGLPDVNVRTLRRLIGHLRAVANQCERNLMSNFNLAAIWGPTLLTVDNQPASNFARTSGEADVCKDLIDHYLRLFKVTREELDREEEILKKTQSFNRNPMPIKITSEVMMFVHIDTKTGDDFVSIAVTPKMTAHELQQKALRESNYAGDTSKFILHEVIQGGLMERPIHYQEIIYDVALKWWEWSEEDRRDTYLLLKRNTFFEEALPCAIPPLSVFGEALYSDNVKASKASFKKYHFSVNNAKITRRKELKNGETQEMDSFDIEKIIWYLGCEVKKHAPSNYNVTFIEKDGKVERTKERPYFGRIISFSSRELYIKWIAAMLVAEHQNDIIPSVLLLNLGEDETVVEGSQSNSSEA
eukprot:TCALIF_00684-PA protein Name:"Similar to Arap2 Arf-GAP with Rho-GAP domain, ANK repeat and PH domain-containing protein 2 (Mus musculus)" AED:0.13 eAED:0.13 QI:0/0.6/0.5/0.83/0.8/0.66/6/1747/1221